MTPANAAVVRRKLARIGRNLQHLAPIAALALEAYRADYLRVKAVERLLQETVDAAVDVNLHLLRGAGHPLPGDYFATFGALASAGILDEALAGELAPATGLRDRIVHEYDALDDATVLAAVAEACRLFPAYVAAVERALGEADRRADR